MVFEKRTPFFIAGPLKQSDKGVLLFERNDKAPLLFIGPGGGDVRKGKECSP